jgi:Chromosome segregation ATPases
MKVRVSNIGGIRSLEDLDIRKGITIYKAPNAFGKTSLMRALVSLMTSELKAEDLLNVAADEGYVEAEIEGKLYYRRIYRRGRRLQEESKMIMDDSRALLLSMFSPENKLVNHILSGEDNIEWFLSATSKIEEVKAKKMELENRLSSLEVESEELMKKYKEVSEAQAKMRALEEEIEKLEAEIKASALTKRANESVIIAKSNRLDELKNRIERKEEELSELREAFKRIEEREAQIKKRIPEGLKEEYLKKIEEIDREIRERQAKKTEIEVEMGVLNRVMEELREADKKHLAVCYLCGSHVDPSVWVTRLDLISQELREKSASLNSLKEEINELLKRKEEVSVTLRDLEKAETELINVAKRKADLLQKIEIVQSDIENLERQLREAKSNFGSVALVQDVEKREEERRLEELRKEYSSLQYEISLYGTQTSILSKMKELDEEIKALKESIAEVQKEYMRRLTAIREEFNAKANRVIQDLGFQFTAEIDEANRLIVRKEGVTLDVRKLSSSERITLALILVITALKSYFKTPLFIVDEIFMTYDQRRLNRILGYLMGISDYVIVTRSEEIQEVTQVTMGTQEATYTSS